MKKLVIFDLDGTLLNTIDDLGIASNYALEKCGFPTHDISLYPSFVGNGVTRLLQRILPENYRDDDIVNQLRQHFIEYYDRHNTLNTAPYDGILQLLTDLSNEGIKLAVASNKYHKAVVKLIAHYFSKIDWVAVEGQKSEVPTKPDPSIVFNILLQHPTAKRDVLYIGDSGVDMETARRACVESIGVTWGFRPQKELADFHADHIVSSPSEIFNIATR